MMKIKEGLLVIFRLFFILLGKISKIIIPLGLASILDNYFDIIYNERKKALFSNVGKNVKLLKPIYVVGPSGISIQDNVIIRRRVILAAHKNYRDQKFSSSIIIGEGTDIGDDTNITCINKIVIGKNVLMGRKILITDNSHGNISLEQLSLPPKLRPLISKGPVIIEDNVWIGEQVCILPNVKIGKGAVIGSNSVVTKDVPAYCVAAGNPAVLIRKVQQ